ncbi:MAG: DUF2188 domain-containing protein [Acholeplasmatales bacterium]|jgi:ABC-type Na+ efflux pump permease subunit|nr:DUF2188 domain-containing protein [Acholeplasmatales bacterium]
MWDKIWNWLQGDPFGGRFDNFFNEHESFKFIITWWFLIVVAIVILLLIIIICVAASKGKKRRAAKKEAAKNASGEETSAVSKEEPKKVVVSEEPKKVVEEEKVKEEPKKVVVSEEPKNKEVRVISSTTTEEDNKQVTYKEEVVITKKEQPKHEAPVKDKTEERLNDKGINTAALGHAKEVKDVYHVSQEKDSSHPHFKEWRVRKQGSQKTIKFFATQNEAIEYAKDLIETNSGNIVIHKIDGTIRKQNYSK